jgi:hypothetical protein
MGHQDQHQVVGLLAAAVLVTIIIVEVQMLAALVVVEKGLQVMHHLE